MNTNRLLAFMVPLSLSAMVSLVVGALLASEGEKDPYLVLALLAAGVAFVATLTLWWRRGPSRRT